MKLLFGHKIFIQPIISEQKNQSGLDLSIKLKEGIVIFSGENCISKVGDKILYPDGVGIPYTHDDIDGLFVLEHDLYSIL
jgi:co-chaperonin GroES (HSP10)